jgi:hypothetical protein
MGGWIGGQARYVTVPYADFNLLKFPDRDRAMEKIRDLTMLPDILSHDKQDNQQVLSRGPDPTRCGWFWTMKASMPRGGRRSRRSRPRSAARADAA